MGVSEISGTPVEFSQSDLKYSLPNSEYSASISLDHLISAGLSGRSGSLSGAIYHLKNAKIIVGGENGSLIIQSDDKAVLEPSCFTELIGRADKSYPLEIDVAGEEYFLENICVGFDKSWNNYYHWLLFAIGRGRFAHSQIDFDIPVGVPSYDSAMGNIRFSADTYRASLDNLMSGIPIIEMEAGLYHVENLYFFWTYPHAPTDVLEMPKFLEPFEATGKTYEEESKIGKGRYYFSRAKAPESRILEEESDNIDNILKEHGFETIYLENFSFHQQIEMAANADVIVAPHGAGLTNLIFSNANTKIVELNRRLHSENMMRPWFYQLASLKNLSYLGIDMDRDDKYDSLRDALRDMLPS